MYRIGDATLDETTLNALVDRFLPPHDLYYFESRRILHALLDRGIAVYTRDEFADSFPRFGLDYGSVYHMFSLAIPNVPWVVLLDAAEWRLVDPAIQTELMRCQVRCGRGQVYGEEWFTRSEFPARNTVRVDGRWFYLLTAEDWRAKGRDDQRAWVVQWLRARHADDVSAVHGECVGGLGVPAGLIREYAGTFADRSGPNCFAAAIGMVVGGTGVDSYPQSRRLIAQWMHAGPFFRMLAAYRYRQISQLRLTSNLFGVCPSDVLVWCRNDGTAQHAAFAVASEAVFQKAGQGWESPWQLVRLEAVSGYHGYLQSGGHIAVYRRQ